MATTRYRRSSLRAARGGLAAGAHRRGLAASLASRCIATFVLWVGSHVARNPSDQQVNSDRSDVSAARQTFLDDECCTENKVEYH